MTEVEKSELEAIALTAAEQAKEVYRDIELTGESIYGSNLKEFTSKQRETVVVLLGKAGYASAEDRKMKG